MLTFIYQGKNLETENEVAIKLVNSIIVIFLQYLKEKKSSKYPQLLFEAKLYRILEGGGN